MARQCDTNLRGFWFPFSKVYFDYLHVPAEPDISFLMPAGIAFEVARCFAASDISILMPAAIVFLWPCRLRWFGVLLHQSSPS